MSVLQCDYRGSPRFFNPLEQVSVAQATFLFGCLVHTLEQSQEQLYLAPVWAAAVVSASFIAQKHVFGSSLLSQGHRGGSQVSSPAKVFIFHLPWTSSAGYGLGFVAFKFGRR